MLADHAGQGRDLRWAVLGWFADSAVEQSPDGTPVPQPPMAAVREALVWALGRLPATRLLSQSAQARTEEQVDAFYVYAKEQQRQWGRPLLLDPEEVRRSLLAGGDPADAAGRSTGTALIQLSAAAGLGWEAVGADVLAQALADSSLLPEVSREMWTEVLTEAELQGRPLLPEGSVVDPLARVQRASNEDLVKARATAVLLSGFGALLVMHGLLMPRTPGLDALFRHIKELGVSQQLVGMASGSWKPQGFAQNLALCLDPHYARLCDRLNRQMSSDPLLFRRDGEDDAEAFIQDWLASIRALSSRSDVSVPD